MSNGGGSRVLIPSNVRKMIRDIKEIAAKHSDEDIYVMLKECNMDPNETAQRLLYLDTFQEVKKKRELKKTNVSSRISEESRWRAGTQERGFRGGRGHYSSYGAGGGRNGNAPRENGVNNRIERGLDPLPTVPKKTEKNTNSSVTISANISVSGPTNIPNGISSHEHAPQQSADPVVVPPLNSQNPVGGAIEHKVSSQRIASKSDESYPAVNGSIAAHTVANSSQATLGDVTCMNAVQKECPIVEKNQPLEHSQPSSLTTASSEIVSVKDSQSSELIGLSEVVASEAATFAGGSEALPEKKAVIFPDHVQVPEHIKNGLTFGSLDFEQSLSCGNDTDDSNGSLPVPEFLNGNDKAEKETSLSNLNVSSSSREGDYHDNLHSLPHMPNSEAHLKDNGASMYNVKELRLRHEIR
ncbi:hypothetical protein Vadar_022536 [Vaccinium darrowii]|uniref:Uncharacterized protein n=1 Tax=Vaccinium darrowii TaxID=229202 RepID=A0ACB7XSC2_9ERIC|nr:hypothetical protein Vadar_022536 [Vaccinium darrowii]